MKIPSFVWVVLILVVGFGFLMFLANQKNNQSVVNATLPVDVEVYVDFNCPHCAEFEPFVTAAREKYGDKVNIKVKMLPFLTSGQNPDTSAEYAYAALAAGKQNKKEEFTELLFKWITFRKSPTNTIFTYTDEEKQLFGNSINVEELASYLDLDVQKFNADRVSSEVKTELLAEKDSAVKRMGAISTPAVFYYGTYQKLSTYNDLDAKIDSYIKQAEASSTNK